MIEQFCNRIIYIAITLLLLSHTQSFAKGKDVNSSRLKLIENVGQISDQHYSPRNDIDFKINGGSVKVFIGSGAIHYQWQKPTVDEQGHTIYQTYRLDVELINSNNNITPQKLQPGSYYETYYTERVDGLSARSYNRAVYKNIYNGIDWVIYIDNNQLKYDFVVHENGDVNDIKLSYNGATNLSLQNGQLTVLTPYGSVTEQPPYTYTNTNKLPLPSSYKVEENILSFNIEGATNNITIDPTLEWSSYFGDDSVESAYTVVSDTAYNVYIAGRSKSINNIATNNAHQNSIGGNDDAYIASFNSGGFIRWATYYGGAGNDVIYSIARNRNNQLLLAGVTDTSYNLAHNAQHQPNHGGGGSDCFVLKMDANGNRIWCTYYGGEDEEQENLEYQAYVISDSSNNIYLAGTTKSDTGIATTGTAQTSRAGNFDAFLVKFNNNGVRLWGTYYGGSSIDNFRKIALDNNNNVYVAGTFQSSGMATSSTHQTTRRGKLECLLARYNPFDGSLKWATYFGGTNDDSPQGLGVDDNFNVYMSGSTNSGSYIATNGASQTQLNAGASTGVYDAFIAKFDTSAQLTWGTYFGGSAVDHSGDLAIDDAGNIVLTGSTASTGSISTPGAHQVNSGGNNSFDAFLAIYSPNGTKNWASYFGDTNQDYGFGVNIIETGHIYICGNTASTNISYNSGYQNIYGGNNDGFLAKFTPDTTAFIFQPFTQTTHCIEDTFVLNYGATSPFHSGNVFTVQLSDNTGSFSNPTNIGTVGSTTGGTINCTIPANQTGTGFRIRIVATQPVDTSYDNGNDIIIRPKPVKPIAGSNSPVCSNDTLELTANTSTSNASYSWVGIGNWFSNQQNPKRIGLQTAYSGNYVVTANLNGCSRSDTTFVTIKQAPDKPEAYNNGPLCTGDTLVLDGDNISSGATPSWSGPGSFTSTQTDPSPIPNVTTALAGEYILKSTFSNGCSSSDTTLAVISQSPNAVIASGNDPLCSGDTLKLYASNNITGVTYQWAGPNSFTSNQQNPIKANAQVADSGQYIVTVSLNNCFTKDTINVTVSQSPQKPIATSNSPLCSSADLKLYSSNISSNAVTSWIGPNNFISNQANPVKSNAQIADSGLYILTSTLNNCSKSDTILVDITQSTNANISINVTPGTTLCPTANLSFSITPGQPSGTIYKWTGPNGWSANTASATNNNITYADSGYYKISTVTGMCTAGADSVYIKVVDTIAKPQIVSNSPVCEGEDLVIELRHPDTVQLTLYDPIGGSSTGVKVTYASVSPALAGRYILEAFSGGCTTYDTANIIVKTKPAKPSVNSNSPVCEGKQLTLSGNSTTSGVTYSWEGPNGYTANGNTTSISNVDLTDSGLYKSYVILNGCSSEKDSTRVVVNKNPIPEIATNSPACEGDRITLYITNPANESYNWFATNGTFTASGDTASIPAAQLKDEGTYILTATDNITGCIGSDTTYFNLIPLPGKVALSSNAPLCERETLQLNTADTSTDVTYIWRGPESYYDTAKNADRNNTQLSHSGYYTVTVTRAGCSINDSIEIEIEETPELPILSSNSPVPLGADIRLSIINPSQGASFKWSGPNNFGSLAANPVIPDASKENVGTYVFKSLIGNCSVTDSIEVLLGSENEEKGVFILFPNPNNGTFTVKADPVSSNTPMQFEIINSIGMIVHRGAVRPINFVLYDEISVENKLAAGVYFLRIIYNNALKEVPFTIVR